MIKYIAEVGPLTFEVTVPTEVMSDQRLEVTIRDANTKSISAMVPRGDLAGFVNHMKAIL